MNNDNNILVNTVRRASATCIDRRGFLKLTGLLGGGFVLASVVPSVLAADSDTAPLIGNSELNAFVRVTPEGRIVIYSANAEMGQGIKTTLPMVIAEEMGASWSDVEVLQSPVNELLFGQHGAGGSTTVPRTWDQMRQMGASAREMLIGAGAIVMEVPRDELTAANKLGAVFFHKLGTQQSTDKLVYADKAHPDRSFGGATTDDEHFLRQLVRGDPFGRGWHCRLVSEAPRPVRPRP